MGTKSKAQYWVETMLWLVVGWILISSVYGWIRNYPGYDDTDNIENKVRSGMVSYTDHGTGCQYLGTAGLFTRSQLIPRVDENGRHICH